MPPLDNAPSANQPVPFSLLKPIAIEAEMKRSFLDYALSVIVSRALPDVRDGLKPVHRRILFAMDKTYSSSKPYRKCAKIVGDVMGNFHPHGDSAIYETMARMAQWFKMGQLLVDGQGNFGSMDGDPAAAMRYTEARLTKISDFGMVQDIDEGVVDFQPNYSGDTQEPTVLPARFPNILVNGGSGIAVGMATSIPPHNLGEVIDATLALINNPDMTLDEIMAILPGPDFPTGGVIQGRAGIREAYDTGRGSIPVMSVTQVAQNKNRVSIIITELPFDVNKKTLVESMIELANDKVVDGISNIQDESKKDVRVVIDLKKDVDPVLVLNQFKKKTAIAQNFSYNSTCIDSRRRPRPMTLMEILHEFIAFRRSVIERRTAFRVEKARNDLVKQLALFAARSSLDEVIKIARSSPDSDTAVARLIAMPFPVAGEFATLLYETDPDAEQPTEFHMSQEQAGFVLSLQIRSLTALEQDKIAETARKLLKIIAELDNILQNPEVLDAVMVEEISDIKRRFATPRRTRIEASGPDDLSEDDFVESKPVVLSLTRKGYIKITALDAYREQARGGKGRAGMDTKDDDVVMKTLICNTRTNLLFFTSRGIAHVLKAYKIPETAPNARGRPLINFIQLRQGETIATVMEAPMGNTEEENGRYLMFVTDHGEVRRNSVNDFSNVNKGGKIAMRLEDDMGNPTDRLVDVLECGEDDDLVLATKKGQAARFPITDIRVFKGRNSTGNRGISLKAEDSVIAATVITHSDASSQEREAYFQDGTYRWKDDEGAEQTFTLSAERMQEMTKTERFLLTVTTKGYGKRFSTHDFRVTARGATGVRIGNFNVLTGDLLGCFPVEQEDGIVLITDGGQTIRTRISETRVLGRDTRGVKLFDLPEGQMIVDVARVVSENEKFMEAE